MNQREAIERCDIWVNDGSSTTPMCNKSSSVALNRITGRILQRNRVAAAPDSWRWKL